MVSQERFIRERRDYREFIKHYPSTSNDLPDECWAPIEGYDCYQISNYGRVKSLKCSKPHVLKPSLDCDNYLCCSLTKNGKTFRVAVHRFVAKAFISRRGNNLQVNHKDGCKVNAFVGNLEWVTPSENMQHAYATGLAKKGEKSHTAKLTDEQVRFIRENPNNLSVPKIAAFLSVSVRTVRNLQLGKYRNEAGGKIRKKIDCRISDETRAQIRELYQLSKISIPKIAETFNVSAASVKNIVNEEYQTAHGVTRVKKRRGKSRLPDEIRKQIKAEYIFGSKKFGAVALAKKYCVNQHTILRIVKEK